MWRKPDVRTPKEKDARILQGAAVAFATIFLSEWGDKGMMTAGAWAATWASAAQSRNLTRTSVAIVVWIGAVLAMATKGSLAVTLGQSVRKWIVVHVSPRYVRWGAVAAIAVLGALSVLEVLGILAD
jgi:putative Ca2+/H+ antiporter (TMEM165/GDT1 family)